MIPPENCQSMEELRAQIDNLDADLVARLATRARYIDRAAELKPAAGLPARIGPRIDEVIRNVRARASDGGLDPDLVERVWRELIEWSIRREEAAMGEREERV